MDPRLLRHYNLELQHLREMGAEFARQFPKIAARLGMEGIEVADPYVERLLEGSAFLAARVQLKLEEEFPRFTQRLQQILYPHALQPVPSMLIAQLRPNLDEPKLADGVAIARGTALTGRKPAGEPTACEFLTGHEVTLWPLEVAQVRYQSHAPDLKLTALPFARQIKGALRLRLKATAGLTLAQLALDRLRLYFGGVDDTAFQLHELVTGNALGVLVAVPGGEIAPAVLPADAIAPAGLDDDEALLPMTPPSFQGHRLLQEYFAFPQRYLFADLDGLSQILPRCAAPEIEIAILLGVGDATLEHRVSAENLLLNCTPAVNLFPRRADRILVADGQHDFHVVPDRTRPLDFEVHSILELKGYAAGNDREQTFHPLYAAFHGEPVDHQAYYTLWREPRRLSDRRKREGHRSSYVGREVYAALVDPREAPYRQDLRQLAFNTLCTNRDLPLIMPVGGGRSDFTLDISAPVESVRCVKGPSRPHAPGLDAGSGWRLLNLLSLNYLSLLDDTGGDGAAALRALCALYVAEGDAAGRNQVNGLLRVASRPVVRRLPMPGPIAFGRGIEITLTFDELAFQGASAYLLGTVLDRFLARHASLNSFVQTVIHSTSRGEIARKAPRCGTRPIL
ncbi:type VI secretion system baseplate subunit TssF [Pigmentiphaga soli]|uniref:Type VI secretion system baseplate subunit TssF n=1 Tax=Pigmentiphaga soli TaxID=1007095 RepID=A0ABP8HP44_9BURK